MNNTRVFGAYQLATILRSAVTVFALMAALPGASAFAYNYECYYMVDAKIAQDKIKDRIADAIKKPNQPEGYKALCDKYFSDYGPSLGSLRRNLNGRLSGSNYCGDFRAADYAYCEKQVLDKFGDKTGEVQWVVSNPELAERADIKLAMAGERSLGKLSGMMSNFCADYIYKNTTWTDTVCSCNGVSCGCDSVTLFKPRTKEEIRKSDSEINAAKAKTAVLKIYDYVLTELDPLARKASQHLSCDLIPGEYQLKEMGLNSAEEYAKLRSAREAQDFKVKLLMEDTPTTAGDPEKVAKATAALAQ